LNYFSVYVLYIQDAYLRTCLFLAIATLYLLGPRVMNPREQDQGTVRNALNDNEFRVVNYDVKP